MSHSRLFFTRFPDTATAGSVVALCGEDTHHLRTVLRAQSGEKILVADQTKRIHSKATILQTAEIITVTLDGPLETTTPRTPVDALIFALGRAPINDLICEKATELGCRRLIFFASERSEVKLSDSDFEKKRERWEKISSGAAKQCAQPYTAELLYAHNSVSLETVLKSTNAAPQGARLICSLSNTAQPLRTLQSPRLPVTIAIGPAGDFTDKESAQFRALGFTEVTLGRNVLRAETAAIAALSQTIGLWGE